MNSGLPVLDPINYLGIPSIYQFNEPRNTKNTYTKRRNTLPTTSPFASHISSLRSASRFQLEKIPEVAVTSLNGEHEDINEPGPSSRSPKSTLTPTNVDDH